MNIEAITQNGVTLAHLTGANTRIASVQDALDLLMNAKYAAKTSLLVIDKRVMDESFFILSSGFAGEVLQKFINYHCKIAFYGDFSRYTSKPLRDFIYESNRGKDVFFLPTKEEAIARLTAQMEEL